MKKIVLTGFKPFGPYEFNPTQDLASYYDQKIIEGEYIIAGVTLPCTYFGAFETLEKIITEIQPDIIINTGLSSSVQGIRIETTFRNNMNGKYPDADNFEPKNIPLDTKVSTLEFLNSNVDNTRLANILHNEDIPVELSANADAFICNSLGYLLSQKINIESLSIKNIFIHIPWTDDYKEKINLEANKIFLEKEKLHKAIELLIKNI